MRRLGTIVLALLVEPFASADEWPVGADEMLAAWYKDLPRPVLSRSLPALDTSAAYRIQTAVNRRLLSTNVPAGFKAGLTAVAGQQRFGVTEPVAGVLWPATDLLARDGVARVKRGRWQNPMLEAELGFVVDQRIDAALDDIAAVRARVKWVVPVLELPDLSFDQPGALRGPDIIAANVAARHYLRGRAEFASRVSVNEIAVSLYRNESVIDNAPARSVMGDQWQALLWLINRTVANGWVIEPGQILITGAIGKMHALTVGQYVADFGELGRLVLTVEE